MISALFYLQLQEPPHVVGQHGELNCEVTVACRDEDDAAIMKKLATEYPGLAAWLTARTQTVSSWNRRIDMRIKHTETSASITGFPASMKGIYSLQQHLPLEMYVAQAPVSERLRRENVNGQHKA
ncbi:hypothetical protein GCG54_00015334 [Colletotrichum gloeosporioides]|uniref:Uncharacterized protein n=1 Tax=Colletotrichum gloeosporioides TaxID=474922 RepID=A0A8H4C8J3_COLGL|nr:uncharacterized protein GCG54_00015334 [Colletotrichum gloeosporioides]KAF3799148.1 hypothetical protein GCG54_00015334 [Colletotrichum gloeosporioides]